MGKGYAKKKKQARQMQEQLAKMQEQMQSIEVTGSAGNGLVTITLNGEYEMIHIQIKPDCVDPEDVEGVEDLVKAAYYDAHKKLREQSSTVEAEQLPNMSFLEEGLSNLGDFKF